MPSPPWKNPPAVQQTLGLQHRVSIQSSSPCRGRLATAYVSRVALSPACHRKTISTLSGTSSVPVAVSPVAVAEAPARLSASTPSRVPVNLADPVMRQVSLTLPVFMARAPECSMQIRRNAGDSPTRSHSPIQEPAAAAASLAVASGSGSNTPSMPIMLKVACSSPASPEVALRNARLAAVPEASRETAQAADAIHHAIHAAAPGVATPICQFRSMEGNLSLLQDPSRDAAPAAETALYSVCQTPGTPSPSPCPPPSPELALWPPPRQIGGSLPASPEMAMRNSRASALLASVAPLLRITSPPRATSPSRDAEVAAAAAAASAAWKSTAPPPLPTLGEPASLRSGSPPKVKVGSPGPPRRSRMRSGERGPPRSRSESRDVEVATTSLKTRSNSPSRQLSAASRQVSAPSRQVSASSRDPPAVVPMRRIQEKSRDRASSRTRSTSTDVVAKAAATTAEATAAQKKDSAPTVFQAASPVPARSSRPRIRKTAKDVVPTVAPARRTSMGSRAGSHRKSAGGKGASTAEDLKGSAECNQTVEPSPEPPPKQQGQRNSTQQRHVAKRSSSGPSLTSSKVVVSTVCTGEGATEDTSAGSMSLPVCSDESTLLSSTGSMVPEVSSLFEVMDADHLDKKRMPMCTATGNQSDRHSQPDSPSKGTSKAALSKKKILASEAGESTTEELDAPCEQNYRSGLEIAGHLSDLGLTVQPSSLKQIVSNSVDMHRTDLDPQVGEDYFKTTAEDEERQAVMRPRFVPPRPDAAANDEEKALEEWFKMMQAAVSIMESNLGEEDASTAHTTPNVGKDDKYVARRAKTLQQSLLADLQRPEGSEASVQCSSLSHLLKLRGQLVQAEALFGRSLKVSERVMGSQHPIVATRCNNLTKLRTLREKCEGKIK